LTSKSISKVLEIENCPKDKLLEAIYKAEFWEAISPVSQIEAQMIAPNVLSSKIVDKIKVINIPIEMDGELVLIDKGDEEGKGHLIELNVRKNENMKKFEGNLRVKAITSTKSKVGIFINNFILSNAFLNLFGGAAELTLRSKLSDCLRNLEKYCKSNDLSDFL
jgi:hypothetical protein